jgi:hypothetical protein
MEELLFGLPASRLGNNPEWPTLSNVCHTVAHGAAHEIGGGAPTERAHRGGAVRLDRLKADPEPH